MLVIKKAKYLTSVVDKQNILDSGLPEFAFVGRSNVGKSSLLNKLCRIKNLAKTSSTPGRTRMINYFLINENFMFVDLPGYGFAQAGKKHKEVWATLMEDYLLSSKQLKLVFVLVDIRLEPTELDRLMLKFLYQYTIPFKVIATKSDKIAKTKIVSYVQKISNALSIGKDDIIPVSSTDSSSPVEILNEIETTL